MCQLLCIAEVYTYCLHQIFLCCRLGSQCTALRVGRQVWSDDVFVALSSHFWCSRHFSFLGCNVLCDMWWVVIKCTVVHWRSGVLDFCVYWSQWPRGLRHAQPSLVRSWDHGFESHSRHWYLCVRLFCVCVVLCVGSGLATGSSLLQGVLPSV
jgi:hypothetical protein